MEELPTALARNLLFSTTAAALLPDAAFRWRAIVCDSEAEEEDVGDKLAEGFLGTADFSGAFWIAGQT